MRARFYEPFAGEETDLLFLGRVMRATPDLYVLRSLDGSLRAVYTGAFRYDGPVPCGTIRSLVVRRDGDLALIFDNDWWDAATWFDLLTDAVLGRGVTPFIDYLTRNDDVAIGSLRGDRITGGDGQDTLRGRDGWDALSGDAGDDLLRGGAGRDSLDGGDGNDTLNGGVGSDRLSGGRGRDLLVADLLDGDALGGLVGGGGRDTLSFQFVTRAITAAAGFERGSIKITSPTLADPDAYEKLARGIEKLIGSDFDDSLRSWADGCTILGGDGDDALGEGVVGAQVFKGGAGNDRIASTSSLFSDDRGDRLVGNQGNDTLQGGPRWDVLLGGWGRDSLSGGAGRDTLDGGPGADTLRGGGNPDTIAGGDGDDVILAGQGDAVTGGAGADVFAFFVQANLPGGPPETGPLILDWEDGTDIVRMTDAVGFDDLEIVAAGADVVVTVENVRLTLVDVPLALIGPEDFAFVADLY